MMVTVVPGGGKGASSMIVERLRPLGCLRLATNPALLLLLEAVGSRRRWVTSGARWLLAGVGCGS